MNFRMSSLFCLSITILSAGCSKEENASEADREALEQAGREYLLAEKIFDDVFKAVDAEAKQQGDLNGFTGPDPVEPRGDCPNATLTFTDNTLFPAVLTLDYGDGCTPENGAPLAGRIIATFDGLLLQPGTAISLTFDGFAHNGNVVTGVYRLSNDGPDAAGLPTFTGTVEGGVTTAAGLTFGYRSVTVSKQTEGKDTNFFTGGLAGVFDDVWSSTRQSTLTSSTGRVLTVSTGEPVRSPLLCRWPVSGRLSLQLSNPAMDGSIDFGDGGCDNKATLTIDGESVEIEL